MQTIRKKKMKTPICFTGTGRSLKYTHENLKKYLIDTEEQCDIFAHVSDSKFIDQVHEHLNYENIIQLKVESDEEIELEGLRWQHNWPAGPHSGQFPKQTYLNMLLSRKKCGEMIREHCRENNFIYDKVVFSRLDISFLKHIPKDLDLANMCVPDFHNFDRVQGGGCNDRFAVSNYENMQIYLSEYERVREFVSQGGSLHAESTLFWHLTTSGLRIGRYPIRFTRIRPNGKSIDDRLSNPVLSWEDY